MCDYKFINKKRKNIYSSNLSNNLTESYNFNSIKTSFNLCNKFISPKNKKNKIINNNNPFISLKSNNNSLINSNLSSNKNNINNNFNYYNNNSNNFNNNIYNSINKNFTFNNNIVYLSPIFKSSDSKLENSFLNNNNMNNQILSDNFKNNNYNTNINCNNINSNIEEEKLNKTINQMLNFETKIFKHSIQNNQILFNYPFDFTYYVNHNINIINNINNFTPLQKNFFTNNNNNNNNNNFNNKNNNSFKINKKQFKKRKIKKIIISSKKKKTNVNKIKIKKIQTNKLKLKIKKINQNKEKILKLKKPLKKISFKINTYKQPKEKIFFIEKIYNKPEYEAVMKNSKLTHIYHINYSQIKQIFINNCLKFFNYFNIPFNKNLINNNNNNLINENSYEIKMLHIINSYIKQNNISYSDLKTIFSFDENEYDKHRKHYYMYTPEAKKFCVNLLLKEKISLSLIIKLTKVPRKSLRRWSIVGIHRKKGCGRKTKEPELEEKICHWINQMKLKGMLPTSNQTREKALQLSKDKKFIASKGWLEKFKKKFDITLAKKKDLKKEKECNKKKVKEFEKNNDIINDSKNKSNENVINKNKECKKIVILNKNIIFKKKFDVNQKNNNDDKNNNSKNVNNNKKV